MNKRERDRRVQDYIRELATDDYGGNLEEARQDVVSNWGEYGLKGYGIFTDDYTNAEHIERIDEMFIYNGDIEAAEFAKKDGIKLIPYREQPHIYPYKYYRFIDTPENREILKKEMKERGIQYA